MLNLGAMADALVAVEGMKAVTKAVDGPQGTHANESPVPTVPKFTDPSIDNTPAR
jgi:hypothetical protein